MKRLTDKQQRFCEQYPIDLNATQAAVRAGYSKKTARQTGAENLSKPYIQAEIAKKQQQAADEAGVDSKAVLEELQALGFSRITDYLSFDKNGVKLKTSAKLNDAQRAAIAEVTETTTRAKKGRKYKTRKFRLHSKTAALEMLGRHLKLFTDKVEGNITLAQAVHEAMSDAAKP
jgi:phage terminase small subunit